MQHRIYRTAKPFVKWVGGKTQLLGDIERTLPSDFSQKKNVIYVEPFVGGGAVLFWILQQFPNIQKAVINDINPHLITTYKVIKEQPYKLIEQLKELQEKLPEEKFSISASILKDIISLGEEGEIYENQFNYFLTLSHA